ncbi:SDR family oxidoreductase [Chitinophagaceae bacterium LB-8]|uniref:SDR family oxidoreductase n=1 Tax=Paraflavisolibacter caeni TaxID=2982496 RepID=A0A9X3BGR8_9BACT|nr:SDR family oxidoreductase [Paraflavisolibacter caeni]MCU7551394.1 SDR family oxidoreductase [Paraflavisolibacter caeni]
MPHTSQSPTVLVAGATGFLGSEICRQLKAKNKIVKGLVRSTSDPSKLAQLKEWGVETIEGDLKDRASLDHALRGVSAVISTVSSTLSRQEGDSIQTVDDEGQSSLIETAVAAGVSQFVYVSFCSISSPFPLQTAKRKVEQQLAESGLEYTILQPTFFMDIWLSPALGFDFPNAKATIYGEGGNRISWIAIKDVAAFAVASLDHPAAKNQMIELGGPEALSPLEVVRIFEASQGKNFELQFVPEEAISAQKESAPDPLSESFAALMLEVARGSEIDMQHTLDAFAMQLTSVQDYAKKVRVVAI